MRSVVAVAAASLALAAFQPGGEGEAIAPDGLGLEEAWQSGPAVLLAERSDEAFLLPLDAIRRQDGDVWSVVMIAAYPTPREPWETARQDTLLQLDCGARSVRGLGWVKHSVRGLSDADQEVGDWMEVGAFPPFAAMAAVVCDELDTTEFELPNVRSAVTESASALVRDED